MEKKLFLLDAFALIFRAYYALIRNPRVTSYGKNTNAQFGFTTALFELLRKEKPTHIAICFDSAGPTERHTDFADYKANRQEAPEDLLASLPDIKKIIQGFNIPIIELSGFEADDIVGTLAKQAAEKNYTVYMVTPDKDYGQLVSDKVLIYKPAVAGAKEEILGVQEICEKWQIQRIEQVIDMLGLMGDAVDNIPGIPGVGEKTAAKLLAEYDTLENVIANADNIKGKMGEKVKAGADLAVLSKKLATIITNVPVEFHEEDFKEGNWKKDLLNEVFTELEFKTIGKRILGEDFSIHAEAAEPVKSKKSSSSTQTSLFGEEIEARPDYSNESLKADKNIENTPHTYHLVQESEEIKKLVKDLQQQKDICIDTETTNLDANQAELVGMSFCYKPGEAYYVPIPKDQEEAKDILGLFEPLFKKKDIQWVGQNIKYDMLVLKWYGIELHGEIFDTMLANYLIEPEARRSMDMLAAKYLNYIPVSIESLIGKKGKGQGNMRDVELEKIKEYAAEDADITFQLKDSLEPLIKKNDLDKVFHELENPLVPVLADMEYEGVALDIPFLKEYSKELDKEIKIAEASVFNKAGEKFNLSSPKQLGEVLFDKMKLDPNAKKTKTGQYATGENILVKLQHKHQIVDDILAYRELTKLKSTYVDSLPELINPKTGRIHTSFNQAVAVTGRLSSNNPNLQNIPIRTERGREIRKAFIARDSKHVLISADYSQIELRIIAAMSEEKNMIQAFKDGKDIHIATAARVYGIEEKEVTSDMRRNAKSVNFGLIYGQGVFGLSENLGIPRSEAKELIDNYFKQYPAIKTYMDTQVEMARKKGYVQTMLGRKRWLSDINSANAVVRGFAERNAINMPIQGTAADMIKLAMISVHKEFKKHKFASKMILQVHDELVFDAQKDEVDDIKPVIISCMQKALKMGDVPVVAEVGVGKNWLEAH